MLSHNTGALKVLACQASVPPVQTPADRDAHVRALCDRIRQYLNRTDTVDLIVLPELCTIEYSIGAFSQLDSLAEPIDGPSTQAYSRLAQDSGAMVVFGMARSTKQGLAISQLIIDGAGEVVGCYDKMHLCHYGASTEKDFFQAGERVVFFDLKGWCIAPIICYDIRIPELSRALTVDHDVNLLLHCGAYFRDESFSSWHSFAITRAMENQIYLLSLNRAGADYGGSIFCPPWIDDDQPAQYFETHDEDFRHLELDPALLLDVRSQYTFLKDRHLAYQC
ncbi:MAG: carbon-nitrogen hydrolase family protein [Acidiferrobacteraceae bacterium]|nr:carbon-nitrogen hydrolase family protein [Acidiferrobacteraceae bacterium]